MLHRIPPRGHDPLAQN